LSADDRFECSDMRWIKALPWSRLQQAACARATSRSPQSRGAASVPGKPLGHAGRQPVQHAAGLRRTARPRGRCATGAGSPWWRPDRAAEGGGRGRRRGRRSRRARQRRLSLSASSSSARWTWSAAWRRAWARAWRRWWRARCCARCCCSAARRAPRSRAPSPPGPSCQGHAARRRGVVAPSAAAPRPAGCLAKYPAPPDAGRVRPPRPGDDGRMLATVGRPGSECSDAHARVAAPDTPGGRPPGPPPGRRGTAAPAAGAGTAPVPPKLWDAPAPAAAAVRLSARARVPRAPRRTRALLHAGLPAAPPQRLQTLNPTASVRAAQDPSADVRQSAFALVGDLSKVCHAHLAPIAGDLVALGTASLQPAMIRQDTMSACNNACWALGAARPPGPGACRLCAVSPSEDAVQHAPVGASVQTSVRGAMHDPALVPGRRVGCQVSGCHTRQRARRRGARGARSTWSPSARARCRAQARSRSSRSRRSWRRTRWRWWSAWCPCCPRRWAACRAPSSRTGAPRAPSAPPRTRPGRAAFVPRLGPSGRCLPGVCCAARLALGGCRWCGALWRHPARRCAAGAPAAPGRGSGARAAQAQPVARAYPTPMAAPPLPKRRAAYAGADARAARAVRSRWAAWRGSARARWRRTWATSAARGARRCAPSATTLRRWAGQGYWRVFRPGGAQAGV